MVGGLVRALALVVCVAGAGSCAHPIVVQVYPKPQRSRREIAIVVASSGEGKERVDIIAVDERGISHGFGSAAVWIEVPPGRHNFNLGLGWSRQETGAFFSVPMEADVEAGRCYRPVLEPLEPGSDWLGRQRHLEVISCPSTWRTSPRKVREADPEPIGL